MVISYNPNTTWEFKLLVSVHLQPHQRHLAAVVVCGTLVAKLVAYCETTGNKAVTKAFSSSSLLLYYVMV